jgi:hypothetical protein
MRGHLRRQSGGFAAACQSAKWFSLAAAAVLGILPLARPGQAALPDLEGVPTDLTVPPVTDQPPAAGRRVKQVLPQYVGTQVYHLLYLPTDWQPGKRYPLIVEYAGNRTGNTVPTGGRPEGCCLGYGISGGRGFLWVCLPYVSSDHMHDQETWWGDVEATVDYCKKAVPRICKQFGGDADAVILAGFSRGAIACNYIGLHDDEIARLWRAFVVHSHYDGVLRWHYADDDPQSAAKRLARLKGRPQFISQEVSIEATRKYLQVHRDAGAFTFQALPYRNHTCGWVLRDIPERQVLRQWLQHVLEDKRQ